MYSMVLVMSMAGAPEVPQFGWNKNGGGCYGNAPVASHSGGCYGNGGCGGKGHGMFGGKLMGCFSGFKHKSGGCYGNGNGCVGGGYAAHTGYASGGVIVTEAAPGCGTVVIPPAAGTVVPGTVVPPVRTEVKDPKTMPIPPKDAPKPPKVG